MRLVVALPVPAAVAVDQEVSQNVNSSQCTLRSPPRELQANEGSLPSSHRHKGLSMPAV